MRRTPASRPFDHDRHLVAGLERGAGLARVQPARGSVLGAERDRLSRVADDLDLGGLRVEQLGEADGQLGEHPVKRERLDRAAQRLELGQALGHRLGVGARGVLHQKLRTRLLGPATGAEVDPLRQQATA